MLTRIDERGRLLIPEPLRGRLGLEPGQDMRFKVDGDGNLVLQPIVSPEVFLEAVTGAVNAETRRRDTEPIDPLEVKRMGEPTS